MFGKVRRMEPLDALRGIAAIGLAIGSWAAFSSWAEYDFIRNLQLSADFILVVAGFIVSRAHRDQLAESHRVGRYLFARFGRHFPLHAGALALVLLVDVVVRQVGDPKDFLSSLLLLHPFAPGASAWNPAAWVVAAELWMSFLFAGVCMLGVMTTHLGRIATFLVVAGFVSIRMSYGAEALGVVDLALRGAAAFLLGALLQSFVALRGVTIALRKTKKAIGTGLEIYGVASILAFFVLAPPELAPIAPFVFASCLFIFLRLKCIVSEVLDAAWPQKLGELSYAIVLTHLILVAPLRDYALVAPANKVDAVALVGAPLFIMVVIGLARCAHLVFDKPTRSAMSAWAERVFPERPEYDYDDDGEGLTGAEAAREPAPVERKSNAEAAPL